MAIISSSKSQSQPIYQTSLALLLWIHLCSPFHMTSCCLSPPYPISSYSLGPSPSSRYPMGPQSSHNQRFPSEHPTWVPTWLPTSHLLVFVSLFASWLFICQSPSCPSAGTRASILRFSRSGQVWKLQTPNVTNNLTDWNKRKSINPSLRLPFLTNFFLLIPPLESVTLFIIPPCSVLCTLQNNSAN